MLPKSTKKSSLPKKSTSKFVQKAEQRPSSSKDPNDVASAVVQKDRATIQFNDGMVFSLDSTHPTWERLKRALREKKLHLVRKYADAAQMIKEWSAGSVAARVPGVLEYRGGAISPKLHAKIMSLVKDKKPPQYLERFLDNLRTNPSADSILDLYDFLEANNLPITEDGHFLAYKYVRSDYKDSYTGTMDNSVGKVVEMPRENVNPNRHQTCSTGLHFCQAKYMSSPDRVMVVKVNPRDVVSIPTDYDRQKGRCCRYEVVAEIPKGSNVEAALAKSALTTASARRIR